MPFLSYHSPLDDEYRTTYPQRVVDVPTDTNYLPFGGRGDEVACTPRIVSTIPHSRYTVDGYHEKTNTVYEFQGCFWHGCPVCFSNRTESHRRLDDRCFDDVYRCTQVKLDLLRNRGFRAVEIWECQWEKLKREREDVCAFVDALNLSTPLNPRDAFFGGRTNALRLYHKVDETRGEKIRYFHFMSLYPWVNKNGKYPLGHPEIISQPGHTDLSRYFGLAKCTVLPPHGLTAVPIPYKIVRNAQEYQLSTTAQQKKNTSWYTTSAWRILTRSKPSLWV